MISMKIKATPKEFADMMDSYAGIIATYGGLFPDSRFPTDISELQRGELMKLRGELRSDVGIYKQKVPEDARKELMYNSQIEELERKLVEVINSKAINTKR